MNKLISLAFLLIALCPLIISAQSTTNPAEQEWPISVLPSVEGTLPKGDMQCGPYFLYSRAGHSDGMNKGPTVAYLTSSVKIEGRIVDVRLGGLFLQAKYRTVIDETKKVPTAQMVLRDGALDKIIVRISRKDYNKAQPCIPPPGIR